MVGKMSIKQELRAIYDVLVLAHIETEFIEALLKAPTSESIEKALLKFQGLKEKIEECL